METRNNNEYYPDGSLRYEETIVIVPEDKLSEYKNCRTHPDGYHWMRVGRNAKYYDNGQLHWVLNYDERGELIKEKRTSHRKDGSNIVY